MEYMSMYYTKEAECQEKSNEISKLKQRIHKLEEKVAILNEDRKRELYTSA
jgi:cell division protein FtsB|tara:strand:+ start:93 stop:245 length:153 start_codon:yes stop_codon:yes gene_type:complete